MLVTVQGKFHLWMALCIGILAGAAVVVLLMWPQDEGGTKPSVPPTSPAALPVPASPSVSPRSDTDRRSTTPADEVAALRTNMRRTLLHTRYPWVVSAPARERFLQGRMRDAASANERDLATRVSTGDRDAAAVSLRLNDWCADPEFANQRLAALARAVQIDQSLHVNASALAPTTRLAAQAAVDVSREEQSLLAVVCRSSAVRDTAALQSQVARAAADGDTPSLVALAQASVEDSLRERYLLSAALLGDTEAQWMLAGLYGKRVALDPNGNDRGKSRFWLEQAFDKLPAASFELGRCLLADCDGQPANPERARRLIESAARQGDPRAMAFMIEGVGVTEGDDRFARYAWLDFRASLADDGCEPDYSVVSFDEDRSRARGVFLPQERIEADRRGADLYERYGAAARAALGCS
jgi:TPR repeat protein